MNYMEHFAVDVKYRKANTLKFDKRLLLLFDYN